jgi:ribosome-interacting GTPase 1
MAWNVRCQSLLRLWCRTIALVPTNLTPEYRKLEATFRKASDAVEKLSLLKQMLSVMPKHKGTDHLQAEIKSRIKQLSQEVSAPRKNKRSGPTYAVRPEGSAQIALVGAPNAGKSALHAKLCGSQATVGSYPFTTAEPLPGMLVFEDVHMQLVDLPPVSRDHLAPWIVNALQPADACFLVVDLAASNCVEACVEVIELLRDRRIRLTPDWRPFQDDEDDEIDPFGLRLPTLLIMNKCDLLDDVDSEVAVFFDLLGEEFPWIAVSVETEKGLDGIGGWIFSALEVVRVYTKTPGKPADADRPFTVRKGETVRDVARQVHKELGERVRFARVWGSNTFDGQQVGPDHRVTDRDVLEIHG